MLLSIFQLGVFSILHCPRVIVCLKKRLDVEHGLPNVLTEAVRVLRVQKRSERRFEREQKNDALHSCSLTVWGQENLLEMWNVIRFSPIIM